MQEEGAGMANSKEAVTAQAKKDQRAKDGAEAMAQYEANGVAVRQNMARLRELRLAKEAEERKNAPVKAASGRKKAAQKTKQKAQGLADWLKNEKDSGRNT
jgi:hypothetical protein